MRTWLRNELDDPPQGIRSTSGSRETVLSDTPTKERDAAGIKSCKERVLTGMLVGSRSEGDGEAEEEEDGHIIVSHSMSDVTELKV